MNFDKESISEDFLFIFFCVCVWGGGRGGGGGGWGGGGVGRVPTKKKYNSYLLVFLCSCSI